MKRYLSTIILGLSSPAISHATSEQWHLELETGLGYDSNAYLSPSDPYFDVAANQPVDPQVRSGVFVPVDFQIEYAGDPVEKYNFFAAYDLSADLYPDSNTDNADRITQELEAGVGIVLNRKRRHVDLLTITPYLGSHDKTYFDRDTGDAKVSSVSATDLSDRYSYTIRGIEAELDKEIGRFPFKLQAEMARLDYVEPSNPNFDSYDHAYLRLGADVDFRLTRSSKLKVGYDYYTRDYDERRARDLSGNLVKGVTRKYTYNKVGVSLRNKLADQWAVYLDYDFIDRRDDYLGYYDYTENAYGFRAIYRSRDKVKVRTKVQWWARDYDNAFAFYDPTQPRMTYDGTEASIRGEYALDDRQGLWAEYEYWDQRSSDPRYTYDRYQMMVGYHWER